MKTLITLFALTILCSSSHAASISGLNTIQADAKMIGYSICAIMGIGASLMFLVDMMRGLSKYLAVTLAVVGIATIVSYIAYIRGAFGG